MNLNGLLDAPLCRMSAPPMILLGPEDLATKPIFMDQVRFQKEYPVAFRKWIDCIRPEAQGIPLLQYIEIGVRAVGCPTRLCLDCRSAQGAARLIYSLTSDGLSVNCVSISGLDVPGSYVAFMKDLSSTTFRASFFTDNDLMRMHVLPDPDKSNALGGFLVLDCSQFSFLAPSGEILRGTPLRECTFFESIRAGSLVGHSLGATMEAKYGDLGKLEASGLPFALPPISPAESDTKFAIPDMTSDLTPVAIESILTKSSLLLTNSPLYRALGPGFRLDRVLQDYRFALDLNCMAGAAAAVHPDSPSALANVVSSFGCLLDAVRVTSLAGVDVASKRLSVSLSEQDSNDACILVSIPKNAGPCKRRTVSARLLSQKMDAFDPELRHNLREAASSLPKQTLPPTPKSVFQALETADGGAILVLDPHLVTGVMVAHAICLGAELAIRRSWTSSAGSISTTYLEKVRDNTYRIAYSQWASACRGDKPYSASVRYALGLMTISQQMMNVCARLGESVGYSEGAEVAYGALRDSLKFLGLPSLDGAISPSEFLDAIAEAGVNANKLILALAQRVEELSNLLKDSDALVNELRAQAESLGGQLGEALDTVNKLLHELEDTRARLDGMLESIGRAADAVTVVSAAGTGYLIGCCRSS